MDSNTQVVEAKIFNRSQLVEAFQAANFVVYTTHDHFKVAPSKLNLIKLAADLTHGLQNVEKAVFVTPSEYDHMSENDPVNTAVQSERDAMGVAGDKSVLIRSDLTFGPFSQLIHNTLLAKVTKGSSIAWTDHVARRNPIWTGDLALMVDAALSAGEVGKSYYAKGSQDYSYSDILRLFEDGTGKKPQLNQELKQKVFFSVEFKHDF